MFDALYETPTLDPSIFRTYDIRGVVGKTLNPEIVFLIGKAVGSLIIEKGGDHLIIARDGRVSSPQLAIALSDGICSTGCDVINLGMVPTPLLYFGVFTLKQLLKDQEAYQTACHSSGVMLTGSHNPSDYNGMKIVINGMTLAEDGIEALYHRIIENRFCEGSGIYQEQSIVDQYIQAIKKNISLARPLKVVIDAGNGVTGMIAPQLFKILGCEVYKLYCDVDGTFPNHHPDPGDFANLQDLICTVRETKADIGLAFDGDGDRLGIVTPQGEVICPDRLLMLFAQSVLKAQANQDQKIKIIFDVKCTNLLPQLIHSLGGEPMMWKTGHSLIKARMAETKALLAGEMSGHFFFKDRWYGFDDALYAGARVLELLSQHENTDALFSTLPNSINTPELKVAVAEEEKFSLMKELIAKANFKTAKEVMTIDGLRVNFLDGWGLLRPSNTTPCLILRFEASNETVLKQIQSLFRDWILSVRSDLVLPF